MLRPAQLVQDLGIVMHPTAPRLELAFLTAAMTQ